MKVDRKQALLQRLDDIGRSLERKGGALLLMGLGSVGIETDRMDVYSDLDFFTIVKPGQRQRFVEHLDWLEDVHPLAYRFWNSEAGCKILFDDGIYGEYAVFEERDLEHLSYPEGRIIWKDPQFANTKIVRSSKPIPELKKNSIDFHLNEALTNLYVGLGRFARGEKLSALRFIQSYAMDNILCVLHLLEREVDCYPDPFGLERRLEKRFPHFAKRIGDMLLGYDCVPESALRVLLFLEDVYPVNRRMAEEIRRQASLCRQMNP